MNISTSPKAEPANGRAPDGIERPPPKRRSFMDYYVGTVLAPRATFAALMSDDRRLIFGTIAMAITIQLYTLVYIFLSIGGGAPAGLKPWLAIPAKVYYHYNEYLLAPSLFMGWILAAGVAQLLSRGYSGKGRFEDSLCALGFGINIACLPSLAHDLPESLLGALGVIDLPRYEAMLTSQTLWHEVVMLLYSLTLTWCAVLFCIGIRATQGLRRGPAITIGLIAFSLFLSVSVIFNR
jgi:hypothetical protein